MLFKQFPSRYQKYVEAELRSALFVVSVDASERTQPPHTSPDVRLIPSDQYDAKELGESFALVVTPNDSVVDVVRQIMSIRRKADKKSA